MNTTATMHQSSRLAIAWSIVVAVLLQSSVAGQPIPQSALQHAIEQGHNALSAFQQRANIPGLQVAIGIRGDIVWSEGFGFANLETRTPATPLTRFRIASVSKSLTGALAARLYEQGKLDLDAPIQTYLPDFPEKQGPVIARLLAGHLSGVRHYRRGETMSSKFYPTLQEALDIFAQDPLEHAPGERMTYTTYGYTLLGAVLEAASGKTFEALIRSELFEPLSMQQSGIDWHSDLIPRRSGVYVYGPGAVVRNAPLTDHSYKIPGGGILSTAEDLVRFGSAMLEPGYLKANTLKVMTTPMRTTAGESTGYGMGWEPTSDWYGRAAFGHGGNQPGSRSQLLVYPDSGVVIALVANIRSANFGDDECMVIAEPFVEVAEGSGPPQPARVDPVGRYEIASSEGDVASVDIWTQGPLLTGVAITDKDHMRLGSVWVSGSHLRCVFADTKLFMVKLDVAGSQVSGELFRGMRRMAFSGTVKGPPLEQVAERAYEAQRWQQAAESYAQLAVAHPDNGEVHFRLGFALLATGSGESRAAEAFQRAAELDYAKSTSLYNTACALAMSNQVDAAFHALQAALDAGFSRYDLIRTDDHLANLRGDARFAKMVKQ